MSVVYEGEGKGEGGREGGRETQRRHVDLNCAPLSVQLFGACFLRFIVSPKAKNQCVKPTQSANQRNDRTESKIYHVFVLVLCTSPISPSVFNLVFISF